MSGETRCQRRNDNGQQCGLHAGHDGAHTTLIESRFIAHPASPPPAVTGEAMTEEQIADIAKLCDALPPGGMFSEPLRALLREVRRLRASLPSEREGQRE